MKHLQEHWNRLSAKLAKWAKEEPCEGADPAEPLKTGQPEWDPYFIWRLLPYETYDPETGLFFNKNSSGFLLEATPLLGSSEETESILSSLLTDVLPITVDVQFLLWASPKIGPLLDRFKSTRSLQHEYAWLAQQRVDYLRRGAQEGLWSGDTGLLRHFRLWLVLSTPKKHGATVEDLITLRDHLESSGRSVHLYTQRIDVNDFISVVSDLITPSPVLYPSSRNWNPWDSLSKQVTDPEWRLQVKPHALQFSSENETVEMRSFTVREFPTVVTQWKMAENLGQLFNPTLQIPCPFAISFTVRKIPSEKARTDVQLKCLNRESNAKSPLAKFKPSVNQEYADWHWVRDRLNQGDTLVKTFYQVILWSKPDQANACERRVRDLYRANNWQLRKEAFLPLQSFLALLPMTASEGLWEDLNRFGRLKTMTAFNAVNVAPLQGEWRGTKTPSLFLPGRRGQVAVWDPFDHEGNFNMAITAAPRKGKSAFTQEYMVALLGGGGRVWVLDAGRSYEKTCKILGGEFIEFVPGSPISLNPFTQIKQSTDLNESLVMLKPLLGSMARPSKGASEEELAFLEQGIKAAWETEGSWATITTVSHWLRHHESSVCQNLAHLLFSFTKEGVYGQFFEGPCTVDFENPLIVMELQELKAKKDLQRIVLQGLIYLISQKMYLSDRAQKKSCIIDEAWDLLDSEDGATAKFIEAGYRTAPKFRGNFVAIAHSIADFHKNPMARAAYHCADFKIILGQSEEAIHQLKKDHLMDIDGFTERLLKSLRITKHYSECVIKSPEGLSVHRILFDPYSRILYSTKGEEFEAVNRWIQQGVPLKEAISRVVKEFGHA